MLKVPEQSQGGVILVLSVITVVRQHPAKVAAITVGVNAIEQGLEAVLEADTQDFGPPMTETGKIRTSTVCSYTRKARIVLLRPFLDSSRTHGAPRLSKALNASHSKLLTQRFAQNRRRLRHLWTQS